MADLTIALVQTTLEWHQPQVNRDMLSQKLDSFTQQTDLIILPEMFTTGFTMEAEQQGETMDGPTLSWLKELAQKKQSVITGSLLIEEKGQYFNRLIWMQPDGNFQYYNKRHLFRMAGENYSYKAGNSRLLVTLKGWNICPLICYDLRFPVWSRNINLEYDVLIYVANWPAQRSLAWKSLLQARAIENLAYAIGVNRTGTDGKGIKYTGDSIAFAPTGEIIGQSELEAVKIITLTKKSLEAYRQLFPAHLDADKFNLL